MDKVMEIVNLLLPALWSTAGPMIVVSLTALVNKFAKAYVPRALQIPLAGVFGAIVAGLTGDGSAQVAAVGLANGLAVQSALSVNPKSALASAKE